MIPSYPSQSPQRGSFAGHPNVPYANSHPHLHANPPTQIQPFTSLQSLRQGKYPPIATSPNKTIPTAIPSNNNYHHHNQHEISSNRPGIRRGPSPFLSSIQEARINSWRETSATPTPPIPESAPPTITKTHKDLTSPKVPGPKIRSAPASISLSAAGKSQTNSSSSLCRICGYQKPEKSIKSCSCSISVSEKHENQQTSTPTYQHTPHILESENHSSIRVNKTKREVPRRYRSYYSSKKTGSSRPVTPLTEETNSNPSRTKSIPRQEEQEPTSEIQKPYLAPGPITMAEQISAHKMGDYDEGPLVQYGDDPSVPMPDRQRAMPPVKEPPRIAGARDPITQNYWRQMFPPVAGPSGLNPGVSLPVPFAPIIGPGVHPPQMFGVGMRPWSC